MTRRGAAFWCGVGGMVASIAVAGCGGNQSMFNPQGPAADRIAFLGWMLLAVSGVVYVTVMAALTIALTRRRRDTDFSPQTTARLTRTVTLASAATVTVLVGLAIVTFASSRGLNTPGVPGQLTVDVIGHQWWWEFQYQSASPQQIVSSPNELHIPTGVRVVLRAASRDVIHSFWVPSLHGKRDLIPGQVTQMWIQADRAGVYRGQCAEFCGTQHARMAFLVIAEPPDQFAKWIHHQRQPSPPSDASAGGDVRRGHDVFMRGPCVTCHTIRGTDAGARVGPELTHVASRKTLAAGTVPNTREQLARWVVDAQSIKPGTRMPTIPLADADGRALVAYLSSLQ